MSMYQGRRVAKKTRAGTTVKVQKAAEPNHTEHKEKRGMSKIQKALIIAIVILAVIFFGLLILSWALFEQPEIPSKEEEGVQPTINEASSAVSSEEADLDYGDGIQPRVSGERKSDAYYTVLVVGLDTGGGGNTDTILLASYDVTNQNATVMSIPRDTMVNVSWDIKKINSVYNNYGGGEKGIKALYKEISQLVGFEPDYQVVVEWEAVGEIVDAMGGVYFDVPRNMNYDDPTQDLHIHQTKGYRLLSGDDAMQVLRYRQDNNGNYGYADGDIGRIATQQDLLKAMVTQLLQLKNITKINELAQVFQDNVETDLTFKNICWFAQQAILGGLNADSVEFVTMPGNYTASAWCRSLGGYLSYVTPYADELLELVNEKISPYVEPFTLKDLDIMSVNKNGSLSSTTGSVEDRQASYAPSVSSSGGSSSGSSGGSSNGSTGSTGTSGSSSKGSTGSNGTSGGSTNSNTGSSGTSGGSTNSNTGSSGTSGGSTNSSTGSGGTSGGSTNSNTGSSGTSGGSTNSNTGSGTSGGSTNGSTGNSGTSGGSTGENEEETPSGGGEETGGSEGTPSGGGTVTEPSGGDSPTTPAAPAAPTTPEPSSPSVENPDEGLGGDATSPLLPLDSTT